MTGALSDYPGVLERAVYLLETLDAKSWARLTELTAANLAGNLSYEAWQAATEALLERAARRIKD